MSALIHNVHFDATSDSTGAMIRMIVMQTLPENGASCVCDIIEVDVNNTAGVKYVCHLAANYAETSPATVTYTTGHGANQYTLDDVDTGRARKLSSKLQKMLAQL